MSISHTYHGAAPIRLNKWMAELGLCSRREAEALIAQGAVHVDRVQVEQPGHKIEAGQTLILSDSAAQALSSKFTAVLNKPVGYVSAQPEAEQIPAVRLLRRKNAADAAAGPHPDVRLAPLGRLDQDSRGLLLLSEDGVLAKAIIGPDHTLEKEYLVTVRGGITEGKLTLLRSGLKLDERRLKPALVTLEKGQTLRFILKEGRKRQIRRMCDLVGLRVTDLVRIRIGTLDMGSLPEGQWRLLSSAERSALIAASVPPSTARKVPVQDRPKAPAKARRAPRKPKQKAVHGAPERKPNQDARTQRPREERSDERPNTQKRPFTKGEKKPFSSSQRSSSGRHTGRPNDRQKPKSKP